MANGQHRNPTGQPITLKVSTVVIFDAVYAAVTGELYPRLRDACLSLFFKGERDPLTGGGEALRAPGSRRVAVMPLGVS
jgi:hypothetical protein